MKEVFQIKANNDIPLIQFISENGINMEVFSDKEKTP